MKLSFCSANIQDLLCENSSVDNWAFVIVIYKTICREAVVSGIELLLNNIQELLCGNRDMDN